MTITQLTHIPSTHRAPSVVPSPDHRTAGPEPPDPSPIPPSSDRLVLTVTEAGELLGISRAFAYELVSRGELPVIRLGRRRLVPRRALLALIDPDPDPALASPPTTF